MTKLLKDYEIGSIVRAEFGTRRLKWWRIVRFKGDHCVLKEKYGPKEVTVLSDTPATDT